MATKVKEELSSPPSKRRCLNASLIPLKEEFPSPEPAAPAVSPVAPAVTTERPRWQLNLFAARSKLVMSLSSPSPPPLTKDPKQDVPRDDEDECDIPDTLTGRGSGRRASDPAAPAEQHTPRGDTGGTGNASGAARGSKTSEAKRIHNAFAQQRKDLDKEPELLQHLEDLLKKHGKGSPVIRDFKKAIGDCKCGNFNSEYLLAVKKRIRM